MGLSTIIIESLSDGVLLYEEKPVKDQLLLITGIDDPFGIEGVVYLIMKAYENLKYRIRKKYSGILFNPENFATELIRLSYFEEVGYCSIGPASRLCFIQYDKIDFNYDYYYDYDFNYHYLCNFEIDNNSDSDMTLTVSDGIHVVSNTMDEWKKVCEVAPFMVIAQDEKRVIMNDIIPCKSICLLPSRCVVSDESGRTYANRPCHLLENYKKDEIKELRKKLPDWSIPIFFPNE